MMTINGDKLDKSQIHTLSALVSNKPGVLVRLAQVFSRRSFNIDSLVVSAGRDGRFSRLTMTVIGDPLRLDQIIKQVNKLVDVIHCIDHTGQDAVAKELALVKVEVGSEDRTEALQIAEHFGASSEDLTEESMIFMITGGSDKLDAFLGLISKYRVVETIRTGKVVMARGSEET